ncbi:MAG: endo-beta-N-acetylglucosaminidase [Clostridium sp.]|uniref:endo-beta-N-acetylglucosaminidase n=1 Tax=Clostridium sp. TaxID=1506 RepID=UPI003F3A8980
MTLKSKKIKRVALERRNKGKKAVACALTLALTTSMAPAFTTIVEAATKNSNENVSVNNEVNSLQPTGNGYSIKTLLDWTPESDPNARYNRASIKLQDRFTGPVVNENANPNAKIMNCALTNPQSDNSPSQGSDTENAYVFSYWQYVDSYVYWGGTNKGIFLAPTPDVIDAGHKNGVPVLGTVGFPWGPGEGHVEQIREFLVKDANGKFPVADKMIEMARFYGFDGWFINQESYGCSKEDAQLMVEFFTYMKETAPDIRIGWYDSMTTDGPVKYQDSLNPLNVGFFQNGGKRVTDEFFLNYNWDKASTSFPEKSKVDMSVDTAKKAGRSQYDVYAGVEVQQNAYNDKFPVEHLLDEEGKLKLSLAMYCPNSTFSMAKDVADFYKHDQKFWVGPTGDPSKTNTEEKWVGLANYVADRSAINSLPFNTNFNLGHGQKYYIDGEVSREKEWNNRAIQDYLPTWRWVVESNGSKLKPDFDRTDAYNGGSSIKIEGNLEDENPNHIKLYSTDLKITDASTELSIVYKTPLKEDNMQIGLCFGDTYDEKNFVFFDVKDGKAGEWNTSKISLKDYVGKKISAISLKIDSTEDIGNYKINIGNISIEEKNKDKKLDATSKITLDQSLLHNAKKAEAKIYWNDVQGAEFYEIYRTKADGSKEYVGSTYNDSYYIAPFNRYNGEDSFDFEVVAVDKNLNRGKAAKLTFNWNIDGDATEDEKEENRINLALNKPVKVSSENAGEPGYKAVDGTVENNSKWCTTKELEGAWLEVDLGEEKTIERWVTMHGEAGGEAKDTNTDSFRLQVSSDGINFKDVDTVTNNTEGVVDRNLEEAVKGRYFRIVIDDAGKSPWKAVRLYEFQLFEEAYTAKTENVPMNSVKAINNKGKEDKVIFKDVKKGQEILLYKNKEDKEAFTSKVAEEDGMLHFNNLHLGEKDGRVYFALKEEGKVESIKLSASYNNETWATVKIPNDFKIKEYKVNPRALIDGYYGTLEIFDLKDGDKVNFYKNEDDVFETKSSVPAKDGMTIIEALEMKNNGGELILEIERAGMNPTPKFKLVYDENKNASTKGTVEIKLTEEKTGKLIKDAKYEVIKGDEVIETFTTDKNGIGLCEVDPGSYKVRYSNNLNSYNEDKSEFNVEIEKAFSKVTKDLTLVKKNEESKPEKPEKPENPNKPSKPENPDKPGISEDGSKLPATGMTNGMMSVLGLISSAIGVTLFKKKK